jgi:hypothetical protein
LHILTAHRLGKGSGAFFMVEKLERSGKDM